MSALVWIPNQPIVFEKPNADSCNFCEDFKYHQLVNVNDISQVQFKVRPCANAINVNQDWNNYSLGVGWENYFGLLRKLSSSSFSVALLEDVITPNTNYFVEVKINSINGLLDLRFNNYAQKLINSVGLHKFVVNSGNNQNYDFQMFMQDPSQTVIIEYINIYPIGENFLFTIHDANGNYVAEINMYDNPDAFVFAADTLTLTIDWNSLNLSPGCYQIRYSDPCINTCGQVGITNGSFSGNYGWQLLGVTGDLVIQNGKLKYKGNNLAIAVNNTLLCVGLTYKITWHLEVIQNAKAFIKIGTQTGVVRTTTGTYTEIITSDGTNLEINFDNNGGSVRPLAYADNVKVELLDKNVITSNLVSNWFDYGDHECTLLINACNSNDGLGFVFGDSGFTPRIRIEGVIVNAQYEISREDILSSIGRKDVYFGRRRKYKELRVGLSPEYVHDFLSLLPLFNNVYINNEEYFVESDSYDLSYNNDLPDFATAVVNVSKKVQHVETNNLKVKNEGGCSLPPNFLFTEAGNHVDDYVLDLEQGEPIQINE